MTVPTPSSRLTGTPLIVLSVWVDDTSALAALHAFISDRISVDEETEVGDAALFFSYDDSRRQGHGRSFVQALNNGFIQVTILHKDEEPNGTLILSKDAQRRLNYPEANLVVLPLDEHLAIDRGWESNLLPAITESVAILAQAFNLPRLA